MLKCELCTLHDHRHSSTHTSGLLNLVTLRSDLVKISSIVSVKKSLAFVFTDM